MRMSAVILLLLMSTLAVAKNYPGMSESDMQKIQKMQSCMEKVDQQQLKALEQRQNQFDAEMKSLCGRGERDEAQKKAIMYEKEVMKNTAIQAMKKCSEIGKGMMPNMPVMGQHEEDTGEHVCDSY
jgi:competence protein ComGC